MKEIIRKCINNHDIKTIIGNKTHNLSQIILETHCDFCKIDVLNKIILNNNGYLLSENLEKINNKKILKLKCKNNHIWETKFINLKRNSWCPNCATFKLEKICRLYFEQIFNSSFPKSDHRFLNQINGSNLELDGFNEELKIAFEHQGKQHYECVKIFKMDKNDLEHTQYKDKLKYDLCNQNNIKLFIIPELITLTKLENLKQFIFDQSVKYNIQNIGNFDIKMDFSKLYDVEIDEYKEIAKSRDGKCLSQFYIDSKSKLQFECKCGYIWWAMPSSIKHHNTWCMKCSGKQKYTIEHMKKLAKLKNGECLSNEYNGMLSKLECKCNQKNHPVWWANPNDIKNNNCWCKLCSYDNKRIKI